MNDHANPNSLDEVLWMCRRGMLELDLILNHFAKAHYNNLASEEKTQFINLLTLDDPVLYDLLIRQQPNTKAHLDAIIAKIKAA